MEYVGLRSQTIIFENIKIKNETILTKKNNNNLIANNAHTNLKGKKIFVQKPYASMVCPFETKYFILTSLHFNFPYNKG